MNLNSAIDTFHRASVKYNEVDTLVNNKNLDACLISTKDVIEILDSIEYDSENLRRAVLSLRTEAQARIDTIKRMLVAQENKYVEMIQQIDMCKNLFYDKDYEKCWSICNDIIEMAGKIDVEYLTNDVNNIVSVAMNLKNQIVTARQLEKKEQDETPIEKARRRYLEGKKQIFLK